MLVWVLVVKCLYFWRSCVQVYRILLLLEGRMYSLKAQDASIDNTHILLFMCLCLCVCVLVAQLCLTLCDPTDCSPPGSSVHGILQARILEWVAILFFGGSCRPRDWTCISCSAGRFFTIWAMREAHFSYMFIFSGCMYIESFNFSFCLPLFLPPYLPHSLVCLCSFLSSSAFWHSKFYKAWKL